MTGLQYIYASVADSTDRPLCNGRRTFEHSPCPQ